MASRRLAQLTPVQASRTLVNRLAPRIDRLRQVTTRFGLRPYNVTLVWGQWSGDERGEGIFSVIREVPLLPNPKVEDLSALALDPRSAGILPVGSVRLTGISATYSADILRGHYYPTEPSDRLPADVEFFYELTEDGRDRQEDATSACTRVYGAGHAEGGGAEAAGVELPQAPVVRARFRPASEPMRRAGKVDWTLILERVSEERDREGNEQIGPNRGLLMP